MFETYTKTTRRGVSRRAVLAMGAGALGAAVLQSNKAIGFQGSMVDAVRNHAVPLTGEPTDFDAISGLIPNVPFVLIGEASHGTHEFYAMRAAITRRLIEERGFNAVLVEADWPDAYRLNQFVRTHGNEDTAEQALRVFDKFPQWMWGNTDVRDFANWLRDHNAQVPMPTGFYGMDLYSLLRSRDAVLQYLNEVDPEEAQRARERYAPLSSIGNDPQNYGHLVAYGRMAPIADAVREQFEQVSRIARVHRASGDTAAADAAFNAEQNARLMMNAEEYYRQMYNWGVNTWNLRDRHMADTLDALAERLRERDGYARIAVWAHNSHLGDARATESAYRGEWNIGQLVRERHPGESFHIGFTTNTGWVMASSEWGQPGVVKQVRPALAGSYERVFHESGIASFLLPLQNEAFKTPMLERAIGVQYLPETERQSHYFGARLGDQFNAVIHFDTTRAVAPTPAPKIVSEDRRAA